MYLPCILCLILVVTVSSELDQPFKLFQLNDKFLRIGPVKVQPRIVNGNRAQIGDFPWHALLAIKYRRDDPTAKPTFCSGAIINEKWILSSADCIANASTMRVDVGSVDINSPLVSLLPDAFTLHPQYQPDKFQNNIALVRLPEASKLNFSLEVSQGRYSPIRLPKRRQIDESFEKFESYFSGFGLSSQSSKNISEFLLFAEQQVISNSACAGYFGNNKELISSQVVCAMPMNLRQGACQGDGGAPMMINEFGKATLIGLLSFIHKDGNCGQLAVPAVFTRITSHLDWISGVTGYQIRP